MPQAAIVTQQERTYFWLALVINFVWINASEAGRYAFFIQPMLAEVGVDSATGVTPAILISWLVWNAALTLAATAFLWLFLHQFTNTLFNALLGASAFMLIVLGFLWLGVVNLGLASLNIMLAALPLAWFELLVAALIVSWILRRQSASST